MRNKTLGILMLTLSVLAMVGYFFWLFLAPEDIIILEKSLSDWAVIIPVMIIVYTFLFVVAWIGWALASTPPPLPLIEKNYEEEEKTEKGKKD